MKTPRLLFLVGVALWLGGMSLRGPVGWTVRVLGLILMMLNAILVIKDATNQKGKK